MEVPRPRPAVFAFFADAGNLQRITPPQLDFRIVTPQPIAMQPGARIDYRLQLFGVPFGWRTEITAWEPPCRFVDLQRAGPYRLWEHTHHFAETAAGTRIDDVVRYQLPLAPLGELAHLVVRWQLNYIFRYRQHAVAAWFRDRSAA